MSFNRPSLKTIYDRIVADMEARITAATPGLTQAKIKRISLLGILATVFAGVCHLLYGYLDFLAKQMLPDTSTDDWLVREAALHGVTQRPATQAVATVKFTGTNAVVVPGGTVVQLVTGQQYATDSSVEIAAGEAVVTCTAVEPGIAGNSELTELTMVNPIAGVNPTAAFTIAPDGGSDTESVEALRQRYLTFLRQPPAGGRAYDYIAWALEVDGVSRAWAIDCYNGPSTVGVIVADGNDAVSSQIQTNCYDYILTVRPLGSIVTVMTITPVNIDFFIDIPANSASKQAVITQQLTTLFNDESAPAGTIKISHINAAIIASTVEDYVITDIKKGGVSIPIADITSSGLELPILNSVTYGVL